jgi:hypothetical protein
MVTVEFVDEHHHFGLNMSAHAPVEVTRTSACHLGTRGSPAGGSTRFVPSRLERGVRAGVRKRPRPMVAHLRHRRCYESTGRRPSVDSPRRCDRKSTGAFDHARGTRGAGTGCSWCGARRSASGHHLTGGEVRARESVVASGTEVTAPEKLCSPVSLHLATPAALLEWATISTSSSSPRGGRAIGSSGSAFAAASSRRSAWRRFRRVATRHRGSSRSGDMPNSANEVVCARNGSKEITTAHRDR